MGLFDDLLKKPPQPANDGAGATSGQASSGGSTGQGDDNTQSPVIKIEKSSEQSIMTEPAASSPHVSFSLPEMPASVPTITAESSDTSGIIINGDTLASSIPTPAATETPIISSESPITFTTDVPASSVAQDVTLVQSNSMAGAGQIVDLGNLFGEGSATNTEATEAVTETTETEAIAETVSESEPEIEAESDTVADGSALVIPTAEEETTSSILDLEESATEAESEAEEEQPKEEFVHLEDYIRSNIEQTDVLIGKINANHEAKLEEAAEYKLEKERFAELEATAYRDAEKMVAEMDHAERMKSYFTKELAKEQSPEATVEEAPVEEVAATVAKSAISASDEVPPMEEPPMEEDITLIDETGIDGSVETALTGLAVQNTVKNTMDKKHTKPKTTKKKEEEFSLV